MRVLIFHPALAPYRIDLFNALAEHCQPKIVFTNKNCVNQKFDQKTLTRMLQVDYSYLMNGINIGGRHFRSGIGKEVVRFNPDIVITHEFSPVTLSVLLRRIVLRRKVKHVIWSADNPMMMYDEHIVRRLLRYTVLRHVNGLILYTKEMQEYYVKHFKFTKKVAIIPNTPNSETFRKKLIESQPEMCRIANDYRLEGKRVLLYVGRLTHVKRLDRLLNAYSKIAHQFQNTLLVLVGDGELRGSLAELSVNLNIQSQVVFTGRLEGDTLAAWYRLGSTFVLPSEFEPFGAVVNEALLAGMPVICSKNAGARILISNGRNGSVVDPSHPRELESSLKKTLQNTPPITMYHLKKLRPSLLSVSFQGAVDSFVKLLMAVHHN